MTRRFPAPLPWLAGLLALYLAAPLVAGARQAAYADWRSVDVAALVDASTISIASATAATLVIALGGIPLGYLLARGPRRAMAVLGFVVQLPLALPPLTSGILLLFLVGYSTPLGRLTGGVLTDSFPGIVLAEVFVAAPFLIIAAHSAFTTVDPVLEGVAATLGRKPLETFWRISLPIAWPSILSGLLLAWLRAFGEFGATVMVAYHPYSLPVYTYVAFGSEGLPAMLPVLLPTLLFALVIMALSRASPDRRKEPKGVASRTITASPALSLPIQPERTGVALRLSLKKALGDFRLEVAWAPTAQRLAILGPSGSGKSLTLKLMAGLERRDAGEVVVGGRDISDLDLTARAIAYVPQNYGLFPNLTVIEQLRFPVGAREDAARYWIERLGLRGLEYRRPSMLSLGQQQRVALARALVRPADLLLLDEPFSALDAPLRARLRREFLGLHEEIGGTTVLVTHDPLEAALLADELLVLENGRALQAGPTRELFCRPANESVARLLGCETIAHGIVSGRDTIEIGGGVMLRAGGPSLRVGERVGWSFAPSRARVEASGRYRGFVEHVSPMGNVSQMTVRVGDATVRIVGNRAGWSVGDPVDFDLDPDSVQVWPSA